LITTLTPGVLLPPDHRHEFKILISITLLDMTTITVIDHGMSLCVLYNIRNVIGPLDTDCWLYICLIFLDKNMYTEKHLIELFNDHDYR
jgi:hypothetical protein